MGRTKQKVILEIRRRTETSYLVLSTVNCLSPEAGSVLSKRDAENLLEEGYDVIVKKPKRSES
jgi:hypothetical protein